MLFFFAFSFSFGQPITGTLHFCPGGNTTLTLTNPPANSTYQWQRSTDNGTTWTDVAGATATTYNTNAAGQYRVQITSGATPPAISNTPAVTVTQAPVPVASFTYSPSGQCGTAPVFFTNNSTGTGLSSAWNFGDVNSGSSNTSTQQNPTHRFVGNRGNATQTFTTTLTVTNSFGCTAATSESVTTKQLPDTKLNGPGATVYEGRNYFRTCSNAASSEFTFTNPSSTASTNTSYRIIWGDNTPDFNGSAFTGPLTHTYARGTFTMTYIIGGSNGCIDTATYYIFVGSNPAVGLGNPGNTTICTGSTLTFPVSNTSSNPPETIYTVTFNDGSSPLVYSHPMLASVSHQFNRSSCGTNSSTYSNSFSASIEARNPCQTSSATVVPIYVSDKPKADFTVGPGDTACVNSNVTLNNISGLTTYVDNGNCYNGKAIWTISPATGWTATGKLGNDFGLADPSFWDSGDNILSIRFTAVGTYTIRLKTANPNCGSDEMVKTICVNPTPTGSFSLDKTTGCGPLDVDVTSTTNTPFCGKNRFKWTVTYQPTTGCLPATSSFVFTKTTNDASPEPSFRFTNPGVYTIGLTIFSPGDGCSVTIPSQQVTVKGKPNVSFTVPATICQNQSLTPSATADCNMAGPPAPAYQWAISSGTIGSPNTLAPGAIVFDASGNQTLSLRVTNECGNTELSQAITVNPSPDINGINNQVVCTGATVGTTTLSSGLAGTIFSWTNNNTSIGLPASGNGAVINSFTAINNSANTVSATITVTASRGGCETVRTFTITVHPRPAAPSVSPISYCKDEPASPLSATGLTGFELLWYDAATGGTGSPTAPTPSTATVTTTTYYVSQKNPATGCESSRAALTVTIKPIPTFTATPNNPAACGASNGTIVLSGLVAGTVYTINYTKNGTPVAPYNATATGSGTITITGLNAGTYNNITVTLAGCRSTAAGPFTLTDPSAPAAPAPTATSPVCSGNTVSLSTAAVANASYSWTGPAGFVSSLQTPVISNALVRQSGKYFVTLTVAGCTSQPGSVDVVIDSTPARPTVGSNSPVCSGGTLQLTANSPTAGVSFAWTGPSPFAETAQNPTIANVTTAASGTYQLITTLGNCSSQPAQVSVLVHPTPYINDSSSTHPTACGNNDGTISLKGLAAGSYTLTYRRNGTPVTVPNQTVGGNGILLVNNLTAATYTDFSVSQNNCPSNVVGPFVLNDPQRPEAPVITSNSPVCTGTSIRLSATSSTSGASFVWSNASGNLGNTSAITINNATAANAGDYTVTATINGCSVSATTRVAVNPSPVQPTVSSPVVYCQNEPALPLTAGGTNLTWYTRADTTDASATAPVPSTVNDGSFYFYVLQTNSFGCKSDTARLQVIVHRAISNNSIEKDQTICEGGQPQPITPRLTIAGGNGSYGYQWQSSTDGGANWVTISGATAGSYSPGPLTITTRYRRIVSSSSCRDTSAAVLITVQGTLTNTGIGAAQTICSGTRPATLEGQQPSGGSGVYQYSWESSTDGNLFVPIAGANAKDYAPPALTASTWYRRKVSSGECSVYSAPVRITVNPTPQMAPVPDLTVCNNAATGAINFSSTPSAGVTFRWTNTNPLIGLAQAGTGNIGSFTAINNSSPKAPLTATITVTPVFTGGGVECPGASITFRITVLPTVGLAPIPSVETCTGTALAAFAPVADTSFAAGATLSYTWTVSGSGINLQSSSGPQIPGYGTVNNGSTDLRATITVTPRYTFNNHTCDGLPVSYTVTVKPSTPPAAAGPDAVLCAATTYNLQAVPVGGTTGQWTQIAGPAAEIVTPTSPASLLRNLQPGNLYRFVWTQTGFPGCPSTSDSVSIDNKPSLVNRIDTATKTLCFGQPLTIAGGVPTGGGNSYTFRWETSTDGVTFTPINGATQQNITLTPTETVYLRRFVEAAPCAGYSDTVLVVVQAALSNNSISANAAICTGTAAPLISGSLPAGGNNQYSYSWEQSTNGGLTWTGLSATTQDLQPGILTQTTQYRRTVQTALCTGAFANTSNVVTITVNADTKALFLPRDTVGCPPFNLTAALMNLQPDTATGAYQWYVNGSLLATGAFPGYVMQNEAETIAITLKTISKFGCRSDSLTRSFRTYLLPHPAFTLSDTVGCGPLTIQATNQTPNLSSFTYFWDFGNGQTFTGAQPPAFVLPPNPLYGDTVYRVRMTVFSVCDTITVTRTVRVKSAPKALFTPAKTVGCSPMRVTFRNNSRGDNNTYFWDFGDGATFSTTSADTLPHTFVTGVVDTFYVKLKVVNECGVDSAQYAIVVAPNTVKFNVAVNGTEAFGCAPHAVSFINNSSGASTFDWNFGDDNIRSTVDNIDTVRHVYQSPGRYEVKIRAFNACSDTTATELIIVYPKPKAAFRVDKNAVCIGDSLRFTNQSDSATSYLWDFGDGRTTTVVNPAHKYSRPGLYRVRLIIFRNNPSGNVCTDSTEQQVQVTDSLPGGFTAKATTSQCAPFTATFVNRDRPSVTAVWDFGDGSTGTGDSVVHVFEAAGTYLVRLTVAVPGGCVYTSQQTVSVSGPGGRLQYTGGYVCSGRTVQLDAVATNTDSYRWDFGNGDTTLTTMPTVYYQYPNPGTYLPSVTLQNSAGCAIPLKGIDSIKVDRIQAGFTSTQQLICGTTTVRFNDTSKVFFGKSRVQWNFGDGSSGEGITASHPYTASGTYPVEMIVFSNSGCSDTIRKRITILVNGKPNASINGVTTSCTRKPILFTGGVQSIDPVTIRQWRLSNGATASGENFTYTFLVPGTYTLQLIAGSLNGCYDTTSHTIRIDPSPEMKVTASTVICLGSSAPLSATGAGSYQWLPLQGLSCYDCPNPVAQPTVTTPYIVEGKNSFGCAAYDTVVITVVQPLNLTTSGNDSICIGQSSNLLVSGATSYTWSPAIGLSSTATSNPVATPQLTTTYRVVGYDGYNCFTDTAFLTVAVGQYPTVNLGPDLLLAAGTQHPLQSTITNGPIRTWNWTPATNLSCTTCPQPVAEIKRDITYAVTATTAFGCAATDSINIKVFCENSQVFIPNAFTPDGDGFNDVLMVRSKGVLTVKFFRIFNRWGELIFEKSNFGPNDPRFGWDGRIRGVVGGPDVFVYTCEVMCENGTSFTYKGNVSIIK